MGNGRMHSDQARQSPESAARDRRLVSANGCLHAASATCGVSGDARPLGVAQRKATEMANSSPKARALRTLQEAINGSPRQAAQRKLLERQFHRGAGPRRAPGRGGEIGGRDVPGGRRAAGLPADLRAGLEGLSGLPMDDVTVHYGSPEPARLGALAFARGDEVHLASGQEGHLPHEAWHVVQQRQGRVAPMAAIDGVAINDDPSLEREADLMGGTAARGRPSKDASSRFDGGQVAGRDADSAPMPPRAVVQRKVGFEFETGWKIRKDGELLEKKDRVGTGMYQGYKVESDDDGSLEFVVYPPLEISSELIPQINQIFDLMETYCKSLEDVAATNRTAKEEQPLEEEPSPSQSMVEDVEEESNELRSSQMDEVEDDDVSSMDDTEYNYSSFSLEKSTHLQGDADYLVTPDSSGKVVAHPQITAGLSLDQIVQLRGLSTYDPETGNPTETKLPHGVSEAVSGMIGLLAPRLNPESLKAAGIVQPISEELKGLVILAASYLRNASLATDRSPEVMAHAGALEYPKLITDSFLLSRTEFGSLFSLMPERDYFKAKPEAWVGLVMGTAFPDHSKKPSDPIYLTGIKGLPKFGPTRAEWLLGMTQGRDLMSTTVNPKYESMGELGATTEQVTTRSNSKLASGGIFEIRGGQTISAAYKGWRAYAVQTARFLRELQRDPFGLLEPKRTPSVDAFESAGYSIRRNPE